MGRYDSELIPELKKAEYTKGYNSAINDYNAMIQWLHDCTDDFKRFMNVKYGYDIMYLGNPKVDEGVMLYDLICDHDIAEVISEFQKWQEEKEKAEDMIECGDEVTILESGVTGIVFAIKGGEYEILSSDAKWNKLLEPQIKKTGRNFKTEVTQLLHKLRGENN